MVIEDSNFKVRDDDIGSFFGFEHTGRIFLRRLDLIHPVVSGNKWYKLKYNIEEGIESGCKTFVSYGGAYSNHLAALAAVARQYSVSSAGIIRGEEPKNANPVLGFLKDQGMKLFFVDRALYKQRNTPEQFQFILNDLDTPFLIPEGGANALGVKGASEIINPEDKKYTHIFVPVGSGSTIAGIINAAFPDQMIVGVSALKGAEGYMEELVVRFLTDGNNKNWKIDHSHHFGGFAKSDEALEKLIARFREHTGINIEHVYTAKMISCIWDLIKHNEFTSESNLLVIHSGGFRVSQ